MSIQVQMGLILKRSFCFGRSSAAQFLPCRLHTEAPPAVAALAARGLISVAALEQEIFLFGRHPLVTFQRAKFCSDPGSYRYMHHVASFLDDGEFPQLVRLLKLFLGPKSSEKRDRLCRGVGLLGLLMFTRSQKMNGVASLLGLLFYANGLSSEGLRIAQSFGLLPSDETIVNLINDVKSPLPKATEMIGLFDNFGITLNFNGVLLAQYSARRGRLEVGTSLGSALGRPVEGPELRKVAPIAAKLAVNLETLHVLFRETAGRLLRRHEKRFASAAAAQRSSPVDVNDVTVVKVTEALMLDENTTQDCVRIVWSILASLGGVAPYRLIAGDLLSIQRMNGARSASKEDMPAKQIPPLHPVIGFFHLAWHAILLPLCKKWWPFWSRCAESVGMKHLDSSADPFWPHDSFMTSAVDAMFLVLFELFTQTDAYVPFIGDEANLDELTKAFAVFSFAKARLFADEADSPDSTRTPRRPSSPPPPAGTPGPVEDEEEVTEGEDAHWRPDLDSFRIFILAWAYTKVRELTKEMSALLKLLLPFVRWSGRFNYTLAIIDLLCRLHHLHEEASNLPDLFLANHFISRVRVEGRSRPADHVNEELVKMLKDLIRAGKFSEEKLSRAAKLMAAIDGMEASLPGSHEEDLHKRRQPDKSSEVKRLREHLLVSGFASLDNSQGPSAVPYPAMLERLSDQLRTLSSDQ